MGTLSLSLSLSLSHITREHSSLTSSIFFSYKTRTLLLFLIYLSLSIYVGFHNLILLQSFSLLFSVVFFQTIPRSLFLPVAVSFLLLLLLHFLSRLPNSSSSSSWSCSSSSSSSSSSFSLPHIFTQRAGDSGVVSPERWVTKAFQVAAFTRGTWRQKMQEFHQPY